MYGIRSRCLGWAAGLAGALLLSGAAHADFLNAETITFDEVIEGLPVFNFDTDDADQMTDVRFSTTDPFGFNTIGPGDEQLFIIEPGLEGATNRAVDLRVDFLQGARDMIKFGFATLDLGDVTFSVFDDDGALLAEDTVAGAFFDLITGEEVAPDFEGDFVSLFPENELMVDFTGETAAYAEFDFNDGFDDGRYIIDNFMFTPAGEVITTNLNGATADNPVLPDQTVLAGNGGATFFFDGIPVDSNGIGGVFPIFIDPIVAVGYDYTTTGANFASVLVPDALPGGDDAFVLTLPGVGDFVLAAGTVFDLLAHDAGGFASFSITGISVDEMLDPTSAIAFVTGLTFVGGDMPDVTMATIALDVGNMTVPVPGSVLLVALGLMVAARRALTLSRRRA